MVFRMSTFLWFFLKSLLMFQVLQCHLKFLYVHLYLMLLNCSKNSRETIKEDDEAKGETTVSITAMESETTGLNWCVKKLILHSLFLIMQVFAPYLDLLNSTLLIFIPSNKGLIHEDLSLYISSGSQISLSQISIDCSFACSKSFNNFFLLIQDV